MPAIFRLSSLCPAPERRCEHQRPGRYVPIRKPSAAGCCRPRGRGCITLPACTY
jgi:hypothetical protein